MSSQSGTGTSEVSKKLKAAIRAKLEELGVYVDDELPDYIMVMIANKKEKTQMKDDLNLFIGKSTGKFVDWLFDLFDRLQSASSKPGETSKKDDDKKKEQEAKELKEQEEKRKKERENREMEQLKEKEKEREREKERQREREREKRAEEEKRRDEKRKESQRSKRRRSRSRSNTYSDEEERTRTREKNDKHHNSRSGNRGRSTERKAVPSTVIRNISASPEKKLHSTVTVKRNIRPTGDANVKARGSMFLRAMNEASASAGYGSSSKAAETRDDDMSDVEALPTKTSKSPKKSVHERLSRLSEKDTTERNEDDAVVLGNQPRMGGPQMILKLSGGKEAIKKTRIQDRVVMDDGLRRGLLKRRIETTTIAEEPKSKHERIIFDVTPSRDSTPSDDSPTMQKWNGQIEIGDDSESEDEEAEIDAFVAEARGITRSESIREEEDELPPTHQLSGGAYTIHQGYQQAVPTYVPTPLSILNEQQNQIYAGVAREENHVKERCVFWPKCTKGDACPFMHPTTPCKNFPNCTYGIRCLFIHPTCRFDRYCNKKHCPFTHHGTGGIQPGVAPSTSEVKHPLTSNRVAVTHSLVTSLEDLPKPAVRGALGSLAEKLAASIKKKPAVTDPNVAKDENEVKTEEKKETEMLKKDESPSQGETVSGKHLPEIAPLQSLIPCRYAGGCRNPVCHFKHPKECRFGSNCRNASCYFYHKPAGAPSATPSITAESVGAKYKWTATAN